MGNDGADIADDTITNSKIADGAVTDAKITGPISASKIDSIGLDADTVDGKHASDFATTNHNHDSVYQKKYANTAVVALSGGDYDNPLTAMNDLGTWCGTPSINNPCLLKIMSGVYDLGAQALQMQSYVDIEGSGENVTRITGNMDSGEYSAVIRGASDSELRYLTVESTSNGAYGIAIHNNNVSAKFAHVTAIAAGYTSSRNVAFYCDGQNAPVYNHVTAITMNGYFNYSIYINQYSNITINDSSATASGGSYNRAVYSFGGYGEITNFTATASDGDSENLAFYLYAASFKLNNVIANASSLSAFTSAIFLNFGHTTVRNVEATASGSQSIGIGAGKGTIDIENSQIDGETNVMKIWGDSSYPGYANVAHTKLSGGPIISNGIINIKCIGAYNDIYDAYVCP